MKNQEVARGMDPKPVRIKSSTEHPTGKEHPKKSGNNIMKMRYG